MAPVAVPSARPKRGTKEGSTKIWHEEVGGSWPALSDGRAGEGNVGRFPMVLVVVGSV
jgi:hypothetical protein